MIDLLHKTLSYDCETGTFIWNVRDDVPAWWNSRYAGKIAGSKDADGYWVIRINSKTYKAHRLAWMHVTKTPLAEDIEIDHKNGNRLDNGFSNLRKANDQQNAVNAKIRKDNHSGIKGVSWHRHQKKWQAQINENGNRKSLGYFNTAIDAGKAYRARALELHGEFVRAT